MMISLKIELLLGISKKQIFINKIHNYKFRNDCMIKIGIYCSDRKQKKEIKNKLEQYFNELNIETEITFLRTRMALLKDIALSYINYNIVLLCEENRITYFKKNLVNIRNYSNMTVGWLSMLLDMDKIQEIIFNEDYHSCPRGVYKLNTNKTIRAVPYSDINLFRWDGDKTILYLNDNETEEIKQSLKKIKDQLQENFFAECIKGYIINLYNVKKVDKINHEFVMYSGHKIPISPRKCKSMVSLYIQVMFGL